MRLFSLETVWREHGAQIVRSGSIGMRWHRIAVFAHIECRETLLLIHFTPNCQFGSLQIRSVNAAPIGSNCTPYSNEGLGLLVSVISCPDWQLHAANYLSPPSPLHFLPAHILWSTTFQWDRPKKKARAQLTPQWRSPELLQRKCVMEVRPPRYVFYFLHLKFHSHGVHF